MDCISKRFLPGPVPFVAVGVLHNFLCPGFRTDNIVFAMGPGDSFDEPISIRSFASYCLVHYSCVSFVSLRVRDGRCTVYAQSKLLVDAVFSIHEPGVQGSMLGSNMQIKPEKS